MKYVLSMLLACVLASPALANEWRVDATGGVAYQHQVIDLPQDQSKCYTTLIGDPSDPQYRQLQSWFAKNPDLAKLKAGTHFAELNSGSQMFKARYAATTGDLPCVRIQSVDGEILFQCSANNLPLSSEALANSIATTCRRRNLQPITPQPSPQPDYNLHLHYRVPDGKEPDKAPDFQPDVFEKESPMIEVPIWLWIVIGICAFLGGIGVTWANEYKKS